MASVATYIPTIACLTPGWEWTKAYNAADIPVHLEKHRVMVEMVPPVVRAKCRHEYVKLEDYEALEKEAESWRELLVMYQRCQLIPLELQDRLRELTEKLQHSETKLCHETALVTGNTIRISNLVDQNKALREDNQRLKGQVEALTYSINADSQPWIKELEKKLAKEMARAKDRHDALVRVGDYIKERL